MSWQTLFEDTFESGAPLSTNWSSDYVHNCESAAGVGRDGSWGCQTQPSDPELGYFGKVFAVPFTVERFRVSFDCDFASHAGAAPGWGIFVASGPEWAGIAIELDWGGAGRQLRLYDYWNYDLGTVNGAFTAGVWQRYTVEVRFSTLTEVGGVYEPASDGAVTVSVDGTPVLDLQNIAVVSDWGYANGVNRIAFLGLGPRGHGDNVLLEQWIDEPVVVVPPVDTTRRCCPVVAGGNETRGTGTGPVGATATHWGSGPTADDTRLAAPWRHECEGGGTVPSASDVSNAEAWDPQ